MTILAEDTADGLYEVARQMSANDSEEQDRREMSSIRAPYYMFRKPNDDGIAHDGATISFGCLIVVEEGGILATNELFPVRRFLQSELFRKSRARKFAEKWRLATIPAIYAEFVPTLTTKSGCVGLTSDVEALGFSLSPNVLIIDGDGWILESTETDNNSVGVAIEMFSRYPHRGEGSSITRPPLGFGQSYTSWRSVEVGKKVRAQGASCSSWYTPPPPKEELVHQTRPGYVFAKIDVEVTVIRGDEVAAVEAAARELHRQRVTRIVEAQGGLEQ